MWVMGEKMFKAFNNQRIQFKLIFYFLTLILMSILAVGLLTNLIFSNAIEKSANESTIHAISQANKSIENNIRSIENIMDIIARNQNVIKFLRMKIVDPSDDRGAIESNIRNFLAGFTQYYYEINGMAIINKNDLFLSNEMYRLQSDPLIDESWYKICVENPDSIHIIGRPVGRNLTEYMKVSTDEIISIVKASKDPTNGEVNGVILIDLRLKIWEDMLRSIKLGKEGFIYIISSDGEVIYSPTNDIVPRVMGQWFSEDYSGIFNKYILGQRYQFIYTSSFYNKWKIVGVFSLSETLKEITNFRYYTLLILLCVCIFALGVSLIFSSSIANPISKLRKLMKRAETGDLTVNFEVKYNDEIGQLGKSFNTMIEEIRNLISEVYKEQKSKREAELRTLQSQIKPHFLYNTLDTIHWMAKNHGAWDVIEVIEALTNLFRIGLSKGNEIIMLSEELEHVKSYLVIQKVRYEEMLEYDFEVDAGIENLYVQKLILQPIVENAIYHGIKAKREPGKIEVQAKKTGDMLVLTVKDNGFGISEEDLDKINNALINEDSEREGFGIFNVNERIRLSYGKEYGIRINSDIGVGTMVEIKHPVIENLKG